MTKPDPPSTESSPVGTAIGHFRSWLRNYRTVSIFDAVNVPDDMEALLAAAAAPEREIARSRLQEAIDWNRLGKVSTWRKARLAALRAKAGEPSRAGEESK